MFGKKYVGNRGIVTKLQWVEEWMRAEEVATGSSQIRRTKGQSREGK